MARMPHLGSEKVNLAQLAGQPCPFPAAAADIPLPGTIALSAYHAAVSSLLAALLRRKPITLRISTFESSRKAGRDCPLPRYL